MKISPAMVRETADYLKNKGYHHAGAGIIMGTGLGALTGIIENPIITPYAQIPHFPEATVEYHKGQLIGGNIGPVKVLAMQGRFHYYEGYSMQQVTFPVRVMKELGIEYLLLSNAAGGLNLTYRKGDLVLLDDHISLLPDNPLRGLNDPAFGQRFTDMSQPYNQDLNQLIEKEAEAMGVVLKKGIYAAVMGPSLETRAEYRWLRSTGADLVGMSTVPEVIVANQLAIKCAAISVVTDECDPDHLQPVNIPEIIAIAGKADLLLAAVYKNAIKQLV